MDRSSSDAPLAASGGLPGRVIGIPVDDQQTTQQPGKKRVRQVKHAIVVVVERLRRVKCDRGQPGKEWSCSQCERKGIACTDQIKPKERGGKLISQAKSLFGSNNLQNVSNTNLLSSQRPSISSTSSTSPTSFDNSTYSGSTYQIQPSNVTRRSTGPGRLDIAPELSKDLIQSYFLYTHPQIPILEADQFINYAEGTIGDLSHIDEALLAVIQAFGARVSSHPSLLPTHNGPPTTIPTLLQERCKDLIPYGKHRAAIAASLLAHALETVDREGVWRKRSVDNVRSLVLLECLVDWGTPTHSNGHHMIGTAVEHMRQLKYFAQYPLAREVINPSTPGSVGSAGGSLNGGETTEKDLKNIEGGLIWWFVYIRDALNACLSRRMPHITKEDVEIISPLSLNPRFETIMNDLNSNEVSMVARAASIGLFSHWTNVARELAKNCLVHIPNRQKGDEELALRKFWQGTDESDRLTSTFEGRKHSVLGSLGDKFEGTIRVLTVSRAKVIEAAHRWVSERHQETVNSLGGFDMLSVAKRQEWELWESFKRESDIRVLRASRDVARIIEKNLETTLFMGGGLSFDLLYTTAGILLDSPANNENRANGWNHEVKVREVQLVIDALKQLGWAWDTEYFVTQVSERLATVIRDHRLNSVEASIFSSPSISIPSIIPPTSNSAPAFNYEDALFADNLAEMMSGFMPSSYSYEDMQDMLAAMGNLQGDDGDGGELSSGDVRGLKVDSTEDGSKLQLTPASTAGPNSLPESFTSPLSKADLFNNSDGFLFMT